MHYRLLLHSVALCVQVTLLIVLIFVALWFPYWGEVFEAVIALGEWERRMLYDLFGVLDGLIASVVRYLEREVWREILRAYRAWRAEIRAEWEARQKSPSPSPRLPW
jgi:hypothetical protein